MQGVQGFRSEAYMNVRRSDGNRSTTPQIRWNRESRRASNFDDFQNNTFTEFPHLTGDDNPGKIGEHLS